MVKNHVRSMLHDFPSWHRQFFRVRKYILPNSNVIIDGVNVVTLYYFKFCARAYTFLLHFFFVVSVVFVSLGLFVD